MQLSEIQRRFLALHRNHFVQSWQQLFSGAMVRARADRGLTVTIRADELNHLATENLIEERHGVLHLTEAGKALA